MAITCTSGALMQKDAFYFPGELSENKGDKGFVEKDIAYHAGVSKLSPLGSLRIMLG